MSKRIIQHEKYENKKYTNGKETAEKHSVYFYQNGAHMTSNRHL